MTIQVESAEGDSGPGSQWEENSATGYSESCRALIRHDYINYVGAIRACSMRRLLGYAA